MAILVSIGQYNIDYRASPGDVMNGHPWGSRVKYGAKQEKLLKRWTRALFERFSFKGMRERSKTAMLSLLGRVKAGDGVTIVRSR